MKQEHILIVEDEPSILYTLKEALLLSDYQVSTAQTLEDRKSVV